MKSIEKFEIVDHGIQHTQYFQGCGVSFTKFENVVTGAGESAKSAFEDCLEQIVLDDFDVSSIEKSKDGRKFQTKKAENFTVTKHLRKNGWKEEEMETGVNENYYYLSIRWN